MAVPLSHLFFRIQILFFILVAAPLIVPLLYFSYYDATVDNISDDLSTCTVSFDKYGNTEIVKVSKCTKGSVGKRLYVTVCLWSNPSTKIPHSCK